MKLNNKTACIVNNDRLINMNICACEATFSNDCTFVVVCNGIGEGNAAASTIEGMVAHFNKSPWCCRSNMEILVNKAQLNLMKKGMGARTTFAAVLASKGKVIAAHAGNTRIFLAGESGLIYNSKDHSVGEILDDMNSVSIKRLYSVLGIEDDRFKYELKEYSTLQMRKVLLCTDGYIAAAGENWISHLLAEDEDAAELIEKLEKKADAWALSNRAAAAIQL